MKFKSSHRNSLLVAAAAAVGTLMLGVSGSQAASLQYSTDFESPTYVAGSAIPASGDNNGWYRYDPTPTTSGLPTVDIQSTSRTSTTNTQALRVQNQMPLNKDDLASVTYVISPVATFAGTGNVLPVIGSNMPFVHIQWDMKVEDGADIDGTSDEIGLDVYDGTGLNRIAGFARSAMASQPGGVPDHASLYTTGLTGGYSPAAVSNVAPLSGEWGTYAMDLDYVARTFSVSLNGTTLGGGLFNAVADSALDVNFVVNGRGLDTAYFDNFSISAVPEPTSVSVIGGIAIGMLARRRSRRA